MLKTFSSLSKERKKLNLLNNEQSSNHLSKIKRNESSLSERKKNPFLLKMKERRKKMMEMIKNDNLKIKLKEIRSFSNSLNSLNSIQYTLQTINNNTIKIKPEIKTRNKLLSKKEKNKKSDNLSYSYDKIPTIINLNKKLLNNGIFQEKHEIGYSKLNKRNIENFFEKKEKNNERKSIILNKIFEKKKKNPLYFPKKTDLILTNERITSKKYNSVKNKYKEHINKKIKINSLTFANQMTEIINNDVKKKSHSSIQNNYYFIKKKIKVMNLLNFNHFFRDSDLDEIDTTSDKQYFRIHDGFPKKYPSFLKTKFRRNTLLKFGSYKGFFFGIPV